MEFRKCREGGVLQWRKALAAVDEPAKLAVLEGADQGGKRRLCQFYQLDPQPIIEVAMQAIGPSFQRRYGGSRHGGVHADAQFPERAMGAQQARQCLCRGRRLDPPPRPDALLAERQGGADDVRQVGQRDLQVLA